MQVRCLAFDNLGYELVFVKVEAYMDVIILKAVQIYFSSETAVHTLVYHRWQSKIRVSILRQVPTAWHKRAHGYSHFLERLLRSLNTKAISN